MVSRLCTAIAVLFFCVVFSVAKQSTAPGQQSVNDPANSPDAAVIQDSGSTNTSGYQLTVYASGRAEWTLSRRKSSRSCGSKKGDLPPELSQRFFQDLRSLAPLSKLAARHCSKSVSFGTTLRVSYDGASSPDLSCPSADPETGKLVNDVKQIERALGIQRTIGALPPSCQQPITIPKP